MKSEATNLFICAITGLSFSLPVIGEEADLANQAQEISQSELRDWRVEMRDAMERDDGSPDFDRALTWPVESVHAICEELQWSIGERSQQIGLALLVVKANQFWEELPADSRELVKSTMVKTVSAARWSIDFDRRLQILRYSWNEEWNSVLAEISADVERREEVVQQFSANLQISPPQPPLEEFRARERARNESRRGIP